MSIVYALVARDQSVLCEYTDTSGNFPTVTRAVMKHISEDRPSASGGSYRNVVPYNDFNFFFLHDDGITYVCMAEAHVHTTVAFQMLSEVRQRFRQNYGDKAKSAIAYGMAPFASHLENLMKKFDNLQSDTPLSQVRQKMERVKMIMIDNVNHLMERGEKIDLLVMRTEKLHQEAIKYERAAKKVRNVYWWQNIRYWCYIVLLLFLLAIVASFFICGLDYSTCLHRIESKATKGVQHQVDNVSHEIHSHHGV